LSSKTVSFSWHSFEFIPITMNANNGDADLEIVFRAQYERNARVIAGIIWDHARAEELALEVFLKWDRYRAAHGENAEGWLYRPAVRMALNDLRTEL
jgi:DNA-directed RNA polymerase specialized sigma24 family protein